MSNSGQKKICETFVVIFFTELYILNLFSILAIVNKRYHIFCILIIIMNEIQILKEIAYYSKFIDQQKKQMWNYNANNKFVAKPQNTYNKYKYVKNNSPVIAPVQNEIVNKVLINPNFKQTVLINPHFNVQNREIHVNPKVLNAQLPTSLYKPIIEEPKKIVLPQSYVKQNILPKQCLSNLNSKLSPRKRRVSIRSKYKIVKSSCINTPIKTSTCSKYPTIKNQYKIDRRSIINVNKSAIKKKVVIHGISDMLRHNVFKNRTWKNSLLINQFKSHNIRLTNISGILYKKTQTKLQKIQPTSSNVKQKKSLVVIKGQKYTIGLNEKSLKLVSSSSSKINKSVKRTSTKLFKYKQLSNKFVKSNNLYLNNSRKLIKMNVIHARNKLRVNNQPCPVYRRYGKCRRKDSGRCHFLHNPNQIFLCKKFLQGACIDKDCLLSHKVSLEKMPTCKYFLDGCCIRNDCSYLHVKINTKADICRKFLEGFCEKGSQCNLRHQFLCPNFERNGSCPKRKCMYPHKSKIEVVIAEKPKIKVSLEKDVGPQEQTVESARYYVDNVDIVVKHDEQVNIIDNDINSDLCSSDSDEKPLKRRPRLGTLPSFIPFN